MKQHQTSQDSNVPPNFDFVKRLAEDLDLLRTSVNKALSESELRLITAALRRILIEGEFGRGWRALQFEKQPRVRAVDLNAMLGSMDLKLVPFVQSANMTLNGAQIQMVMHFKAGFDIDNFRPPAPVDSSGFLRVYSLTEFADSKCMHIKGVSVTRQQLVQYMAYKLGAIHSSEDQTYKGRVGESFACLDSICDGNVGGAVDSEVF